MFKGKVLHKKPVIKKLGIIQKFNWNKYSVEGVLLLKLQKISEHFNTWLFHWVPQNGCFWTLVQLDILYLFFTGPFYLLWKHQKKTYEKGSMALKWKKTSKWNFFLASCKLLNQKLSKSRHPQNWMWIEKYFENAQ